MKPQMRQKATRKKSTRCKSKRQKAIRRTYKKVIKGGEDDPIKIRWRNDGIYLLYKNEEDDDKTIIRKINEYLGSIEGVINKFLDKKSLISWLNEADKAIARFKAQLSDKKIGTENIDKIILPLKRRAFDVREKLYGVISGRIEKVNNGKPTYRNYTPIKLPEIIPDPSSESESSSESEPSSESDPSSEPMATGNNFSRTKFNIMMNTLKEQQNAALKAAYKASARNAALKAEYKAAHNASKQNAADNASAQKAALKANKASVSDIFNALKNPNIKK